MTRPHRRPLAALATGVALLGALVACGGVTAAPAGTGSTSASAGVSLDPPPTPRASDGEPGSATPAGPQPAEPTVATRQSASYARIGESVAFDHVTVTVVEIRQPTDRFDLLVKTCATKLPAGSSATTMRLGADAWSLSTSAGVKTPAGSGPDGDRYPAETQAGVGQCVRGWLRIPVPTAAEVTDINYRNGVGEVGSWRPDL